MVQQYFSLEQRNKSRVLYNFFLFFFLVEKQPCVEQTTTKNRVLTTNKTQRNSVSVAIQFLLYLQTHTHRRSEPDANTHRQCRPSLQLCSAYAKIRIYTHPYAHMYILVDRLTYIWTKRQFSGSGLGPNNRQGNNKWTTNHKSRVRVLNISPILPTTNK